MKIKVTIIFGLISIINLHSQNLYTTKRNYNNPTNYVHSLQKLNQTNGLVLNSNNYTSTFPGSYSPESLNFNPLTNEIIGISDINIITKKNIQTGVETTLTLPLLNSTVYQGVLIFNNRLFVTKKYSGNNPATHYILEINTSNGSVITTHQISTNISTSNNRDLCFSSQTNQILGLSGNNIYKYNVENQVETSIALPNISGTDYTDLIVAENRLFVIKRDYNSSPTNHYIIELNINTGSVINSTILTTNFVGYDKIKSLTFLANSHEICGIINDYSNPQNFKILKYNILNNIENSFNLVSETSTDYDEIVSTFNEESLSNETFEIHQNFKILKVYNLLGQEVSINSTNQIILVKYENGIVKKIFNKEQ